MSYFGDALIIENSDTSVDNGILRWYNEINLKCGSYVLNLHLL